MAYALVGALGVVATGTSTVQPQYGQSPTAGNLLVAWVYDGNGPTAWPTPSGWSAGQHRSRGGIFYRIAAGADARPTFGTAASGATVVAALAEFSGNAAATPLDQGGDNTGTTPVTATAGGTDTAAKELMLGVSFGTYSKSGTTTTTHAYTDSGGSAPAAQAVGNNDGTSTGEHYRYSYAIGTNAAATQADTLTTTDNSMNLISHNPVINSFKLAAVAAFAPPFRSKSIHNALVR